MLMPLDPVLLVPLDVLVVPLLVPLDVPLLEDVLLDDPPVEVDPPLDAELPLDDPPPVLVVEEMTTPPPLPPPPPKKPPAKKPPPPPKPPPPASTTPPPLPPAIGNSPLDPVKGGGSGTGVPWLVTVTTAGGQTARVWVTTRRTRLFGRCTRVCTTFRTFFTYPWRACADSVTWTAPPPITAPPHAQAQSFAKAIRTDIASLFLDPCRIDQWVSYVARFFAIPTSAEQRIKFNGINHQIRTLT